jgi:hypothetical protein
MALTKEQEDWVAAKLAAENALKDAEAIYKSVMDAYVAERVAQEKAHSDAMAAIDARHADAVESARVALETAKHAVVGVREVQL